MHNAIVHSGIQYRVLKMMEHQNRFTERLLRKKPQLSVHVDVKQKPSEKH